jgi:hypothetical protein
MPFRPLHPAPSRARVVTALAVSHLVVFIPFLTINLRVIAAVYVQLKAVLGQAPQYVVFYYLTRPGIRR